MSRGGRTGEVLTALCGAAAIGLLITVLPLLQDDPNPTIAALLLLLIVLASATVAGLRVAIGISVAAMIGFNFFLLPPFHTFAIADAQNWVVLFVFVAVAIIASQLSAAARHRATEAETRKLEVTRLFDLSRDILLTTQSETAIADMARFVANRFELEAVAICLPAGDGRWILHQGGERLVEPRRAELEAAIRRRSEVAEPDAAAGGTTASVVAGQPAGRTTIVALMLGTRPMGLLATDSTTIDAGTLDALGGVVAIAIERSHFLAERKQSEALTQRADLASALLASFSHDLRTPVTSVRVAVTNLQDTTLSAEERNGQAQLALQELDRLTLLFQDILDMARIDAAAVNPERQWVTSADLIDAALAHVGPVLADRPLEIEADATTALHLDPRLTAKAVAHLLENAARYSPAGSPILIRAWTERDGAHLQVRDHGPGLDPSELDRLFEPFYRSPKTRHATGTGLGLAITRGLLAAEGGRVWCENVPGGGARFSIVVPAALREIDSQAS